jgi:hypothetical protein
MPIYQGLVELVQVSVFNCIIRWDKPAKGPTMITHSRVSCSSASQRDLISVKTPLTLDVCKSQCTIKSNTDIFFIDVSDEVYKLVGIRECIDYIDKPMSIFFCSCNCHHRKREGSDQYFQNISNVCLFHTSRKLISLTKYNNKLMPRKN